ncbi:MAG: glycosyltransferase [Candidatus Omnitrophica bacterium]|nr:glycosyltransferase [Candidatus Omnitrophota bacterium]
MIKNQNIICFSSVDWTSYRTSKIYLMKIMSKYNRVLFVETIGSKMPSFCKSHLYRIIKRIFRWLKGPTRPPDTETDSDILIYSPLIIPIHHNRFARKMNFYILRWTFRKLIKKLNFKQPILWFYLPTAADLKGQLSEKFCLYHCVDNWLTYPGYRNNNFEDLESKLFINSNAVFISNRLLFDAKKALNKNTHYLPHGVEFEHYQRTFASDDPLPVDVRNLRRPIIAMVGEVAGWVDFDFIRYVAKAHPEWSIVLIGPIGYDADISKIKDISNIYFLGNKEYSELPNYYRAIDVFIIPFILNEHIKYCTPTRIYEHLSSGKPVITTDFPAAREIDESLIHIALNREDFVKKIEVGLKERDFSLIEKRKSLAKQNTWESRAQEISKIIEEVISNGV